MSVEHTLAIITPEGAAHSREIIARLKTEGFVILASRRVQLTPEQASDFYQDRYGRRDFPLLVAATSASPLTALLLGRNHAVQKLLEVVGPEDVPTARVDSPLSLNALFGNHECNLAVVHASDGLVQAHREVLFFFPSSVVEPVDEVIQGLRFLEREVCTLLKEGLARMLKEKPTEPLLWLAGWLLENNPEPPVTQEHLRHHSF